jgi:hypothetical protein
MYPQQGAVYNYMSCYEIQNRGRQNLLYLSSLYIRSKIHVVMTS